MANITEHQKRDSLSGEEEKLLTENLANELID